MGDANETNRRFDQFFDPVENLKAVADMQAAGIDAAARLLGRFLQGGTSPNGKEPSGFSPRFGAEASDGDGPRSTRDLRIEAEQFIDQLANAAKRMLDVWTDLGARGPRTDHSDRVVVTVVSGVGTATTVIPTAVGDVVVSDARSLSGAEIAAACISWQVLDLGDDFSRLAIRVDIPDDVAPGVYHAVMSALAVQDFARLVTVMIPQRPFTTPQSR